MEESSENSGRRNQFQVITVIRVFRYRTHYRKSVILLGYWCHERSVINAKDEIGFKFISSLLSFWQKWLKLPLLLAVWGRRSDAIVLFCLLSRYTRDSHHVFLELNASRGLVDLIPFLVRWTRYSFFIYKDSINFSSPKLESWLNYKYNSIVLTGLKCTRQLYFNTTDFVRWDYSITICDINFRFMVLTFLNN